MSFDSWWTFLIGSIVVCSSPGPNMLLVLSSSVENGFRKSIYTMAGCLTAVSLIIFVSIVGVGALLSASPKLFAALRYLGAAYLVYIGVRSCTNKEGRINISTTNGQTDKKDLFKKGFFTGLSNPKAILFAMAFFSQFIEPTRPFAIQFSILFLTFVVVECSCYVTYALCGKTISEFLRNPKMMKMFNFAIGLVFIGFGIFLFLQ